MAPVWRRRHVVREEPVADEERTVHDEPVPRRADAATRIAREIDSARSAIALVAVVLLAVIVILWLL